MIENESEMRVKNKIGAGLLAIVLMVAGLLTVATPAQATACSPSCYGYAGFRQTVNFDGVAVLLGKENPATDAKTWHTLAEVAVTDSTGTNTIEVGWTKDPLVCAAGVSVCLFMFAWRNGVPLGYNASSGAINGTGCSPYCLGASLDSIANNTSKNFALQHINGAWWAAYDGAWRFAMPDTVMAPYAFSQGAQYQIFGEVAMKDDTSCVDMMQPVMPTGSPTFLGGKANSMTLVNGSAAVAPTAFATSPTKWNALMITGISGRFSGDGNC